MLWQKIMIFIGILFVLVGCSSQIQVQLEDMQKIDISLHHYEETEDHLLYVLALQNNSPYILKQNTVYVGYQIKIENGSKASRALFKAEGNRLDIQPNEKVDLTVLVPKDELPNSAKILEDSITYELHGFLNEVTQETSFHTGGSVRISK